MITQLGILYLLIHAVRDVSASSYWNHTDDDNNNGTYLNARPVLERNFPDPALIKSGGAWYAFATSGNGKNVQAAVTGDFREHDWRLLEDADVLPDPGPWAVNDGNIWAPDIIQLDDSRWVMYYSAPSKAQNRSHCIGAAISNNILGPYDPVRDPIACPLDKGGAIDPAGFKDPLSGNLYVVYKVDGNSLNIGSSVCKGGKNSSNYHPTPIMLQRVANDGVSLQGEAFEILDRSESDGPLVEAPSLFYQPDCKMYYLTFSSNCYSTDRYDISFAYSTDLHSTFSKSTKPIMTTGNGPVRAPGGADMTADGTFAVFHGTVGLDDKGEPIRHMFAAESEQIGTDMTAWII